MRCPTCGRERRDPYALHQEAARARHERIMFCLAVGIGVGGTIVVIGVLGLILA